MSKASETVYAALEAVKGISQGASPQASLTRDLGLESIDMVDLFFEIEQATGVVVELNQLIGSSQGRRRFEEIALQDLIDFLEPRLT